MSKKNQTAGKTAMDTMGAMRLSLIAARKLNNKKPISRDFVSGNPSVSDPDKVFEGWCHAIAEIYRVIEPWALNFNNIDAQDTDLQAVVEAVVPMWTALATDVDPKMFVRTADVTRLVNFALDRGSSKNGSVDVILNITSFRKEVEAMMGIRISQSAVLTEDEYKVVRSYEGTLANIAKLEAKLSGTTNAKGEHRQGLEEDLESAKAKLAEMKALAIELGAKEDEIDDNPLISGYIDTVNDLDAKIAKTKKKISEYKDYIKTTKKTYESIMAKVNVVEA